MAQGYNFPIKATEAGAKDLEDALLARALSSDTSITWLQSLEESAGLPPGPFQLVSGFSEMCGS